MHARYKLVVRCQPRARTHTRIDPGGHAKRAPAARVIGGDPGANAAALAAYVWWQRDPPIVRPPPLARSVQSANQPVGEVGRATDGPMVASRRAARACGDPGFRLLPPARPPAARNISGSQPRAARWLGPGSRHWRWRRRRGDADGSSSGQAARRATSDPLPGGMSGWRGRARR